MERILITGTNGLLGQKCSMQLASNYQLFGCDVHDSFIGQNKKVNYTKLDITNRGNVKHFIKEINPQIIINAAAYTDVDGSENHKELCWKINVEGVQNLVYAAEKINAKIIHISSDYIFDGTKGPYKETDIPNALGYYGKSKLASENVFFQSDIDYAIIRTMVLYGFAENIRPNFVTWLIEKLKNGESVTIVTDQFGNPTLADDLARAIKQVIINNAWDLYHISGNEIIDRYSFAIKIADIFKLNKELIKPITTKELNQVSLRPLRSGFILDKIRDDLNLRMLNIDESLKQLKKQMTKLKLLHLIS